SSAADIENVMHRLRSGVSVALISDAGTPLVSDPGYRLVAACQRERVPVVPIPGPSAVTSALSAAGLPSDRFYFEGFLPAKSGQRLNRLKALRSIESTLIFFESPRRLSATLDAMSSEFGDREAALCRELTKRHETIRRDRLLALSTFVATDPNQQRGEAVILVSGFDATEVGMTSETAAWLERLSSELPPRRVAALVADMTGTPARELYQWLLSRRKNT
ncbi:MAG: 16S rRNA (cytidine(1402)-2'-O)-methyltransferase, partial [Luminiphilus sp.]|nr:16S rRNA (cytidine(1402)-2'-O)-methyltransferase [Luminiphilus sp.]